jgi:hypothetical protein
MAPPNLSSELSLLTPTSRSPSFAVSEPHRGQIALRVGCGRRNVHQVLCTFLDGHTEQELRDYQAKKADIYDAFAMRLLESVTQQEIQKRLPEALQVHLTLTIGAHLVPRKDSRDLRGDEPNRRRTVELSGGTRKISRSRTPPKRDT